MHSSSHEHGNGNDSAAAAAQVARLSLIGERYLAFMGKTFPVMALSENFYTFPRAHAALEQHDRLEVLSEASLAQATSTVRGLRDELLAVDADGLPLEERIDCHLLHGSMSTFLRDMERRRVWQSDPLLYVKLLNLCTDLNPSLRLPQVPRLLAEARRNLRQMPRIAVEIALSMLSGPTGAAQRALGTLEVLHGDAGPLRQALGHFEGFLEHALTEPDTAHFACGEDEFQDALGSLAGLDLSVQAAWRRGQELRDGAEAALRQIASRLGYAGSPSDVEASLRREHGPQGDLHALYTQSQAEARDFLLSHRLLTLPSEAGYHVTVAPTETAWLAAKSMAGYNCPRGQRRAVLHINVGDPPWHADYALTVAHELYPGHHLQGVVARQNPRSIRQQIELPIFYEGWATYAEMLMVEEGFWGGDVAAFFAWRLRHLRATRVLADIGLHTDRLTVQQAWHLLRECLPDDIARREARRYTTTPGYQISYALGADCLTRLRQRFEPRLGLRQFHDTVLEGGDLPWRWVEARLEARAQTPAREEAA
jgi:uncharacterized protein (DUF885 family)